MPEYFTKDTFEHEHVRISALGLFKVRHARNKKLRDKSIWAVSRVKKLEVIGRLKDYCIIENGTTLLDIINTVDQYPLLKSFLADYSHCPNIDKFHEYARKPVDHKKSKQTDGIDKIEVSRWPIESLDYVITINNVSGVGVRCDHMGEPLHDQSLPRDQGYGIEHTPINELVHLPVVLNDNIEIYKNKFKDKTVWQGRSPFCLLDVLDEIYEEISFVSHDPEEVGYMLDEMRDLKEQVDRMTEEEFRIRLKPLSTEELTEEIEKDEDDDPRQR